MFRRIQLLLRCSSALHLQSVSGISAQWFSRDISRSLSDGPSPVSRKSRKASSSTVNYGYAEGTDDRSFQELADSCLQSIYDAVIHMKATNDPFDITVENREISLGLGGDGTFVFALKYKNELLQVNSPVSGLLVYQYDRKRRFWANVRDGHDFRGIVTRDLLRLCSGCPQFK